MIKQRWFIHMVVTPFMCSKIDYSIVISEDPMDFVIRNSIDDGSDTEIKLLFFKEISLGQYDKMKPLNPTNSGCYLKLKRKDYSKFYDD